MSRALWCVANRRGAAGLLGLVEGRRLDLQVPARVEHPPDRLDDPRPLDEDVADAGRDEEVDVALAVALLDVGEAVPLLGQRPERLGEDGEGGGLHRQLARLGPRRGPLGGDDVAHVEELVDLEGLVADLVLLHPDLDLAGAVADLEEGRLAEGAVGEDAAGDRPATGVRRDLLGLLLAVPVVEILRDVGRAQAVAVRVHAEGAQRLGLLQSLRQDLALGGAEAVLRRGRLVGHLSGICRESVRGIAGAGYADRPGPSTLERATASGHFWAQRSSRRSRRS